MHYSARRSVGARFSDVFVKSKREKGARPMKNPGVRCAVAALLLSGAVPAHAQSSYWYTGLGVGYSRIQFYPADFQTLPTDSKKEFDAGFKGFLGYQISRNWAAEVSYATVGKFKYKVENSATGISENRDYKVTGVGFALIPTVPFTRKFSVFGRFGAFFSETTINIRNPGAVASGTVLALQDSEPTFLTGFGMQYFFAGESGIRIEFENLGTVGNGCTTGQFLGVDCTGRANVKMGSVSAVFKF